MLKGGVGLEPILKMAPAEAENVETGDGAAALFAWVGRARTGMAMLLLQLFCYVSFR